MVGKANIITNTIIIYIIITLLNIIYYISAYIHRSIGRGKIAKANE